MNKRQIRVIIELSLGLIFGIPSLEDIFAGIFKEMLNQGNYFAIIGYITAVLVGLILFLDGLAVFIGFKNIKEMFKYFD